MHPAIIANDKDIKNGENEDRFCINVSDTASDHRSAENQRTGPRIDYNTNQSLKFSMILPSSAI